MKVMISLYPLLRRPVGSERRRERRNRRKAYRRLQRFLRTSTVTLTVSNTAASAYDFKATVFGKK